MKFRKKPVVIEAVQWQGDNRAALLGFCKSLIARNPRNSRIAFCKDESVFIKTLEGTMEGKKGDWIIKGVKGEFYPCKPDIFKQTYEKDNRETTVIPQVKEKKCDCDRERKICKNCNGWY